ncbi:hypothetical protein C486_01094 [Natrinema gari JCM 14663]|uniref:Uncharacterized protein n=1 Tax=Natrinema gari JCM 14663 TaxID=1230459 RepID=L9ZDV7_9EURY|nr:hypothetical protein C486_01094 [Natrinema gari JCM 14663]
MGVFTGDERFAVSPSPNDSRRPSGADTAAERTDDRTRRGFDASPTTREPSRRPGWARW